MNDLQGVEPNKEANLIPNVPGLEGASDEAAAALASMIEQVQGQALEENPGLKFDPPAVPEDLKTLNFRKRYDTMQDQFTKMMMESGKLAKAQKVRFSFSRSCSGVGLLRKLTNLLLEHGSHSRSPSHRLSSPD